MAKHSIISDLKEANDEMEQLYMFVEDIIEEIRETKKGEIDKKELIKNLNQALKHLEFIWGVIEIKD